MFKKNEEQLYQRTTAPPADTRVVFLQSWTSYLITQEHRFPSQICAESHVKELQVIV